MVGLNKSETIAIEVSEKEPSARGESKSSRRTTAVRDEDNQYHIRLSLFRIIISSNITESTSAVSILYFKDI